MPIDDLIGGGSFSSSSSQNVVYTQPVLDPLGCNPTCVVPATPRSALLRPMMKVNKCQFEITLTNTGATGVEPGPSVFGGLGMKLSNLEMHEGWEECFGACSEALEGTLFTDAFSGSDETPPTIPPMPGADCLLFWNEIFAVAGVYVTNAKVEVPSGNPAQLDMPLGLISADLFSGQACEQEINVNPCPICPNPSGVETEATFTANCPMPIDPFNAITYEVLPGETVTLTFCYVAGNLVNPYIDCAGNQVAM